MVDIKTEIFLIYQIKNKVNEKLYIGQTKQSLKKRFSNHRHSKTIIGNAIRKYGLENFEISILQTCFSQNEADILEIHWINLKNTIDKNIGYNIENGGKKIKEISENTKRKISESHKKRLTENPNAIDYLYTQESINKRVISWKEFMLQHPECKEKFNQTDLKRTTEQIETIRQSQIGKILSEDTKFKISQANLGQKRSPETIALLIEKAIPRKGIKRTEDVKLKIIQTKKLNPYCKFTLKQQKEICDLYQIKSAIDISEQFQCNIKTVLKILKANDIKIRRNGKFKVSIQPEKFSFPLS